MSTTTSHASPAALLAIAATTVFSGGFIGATTTAINGAVSPGYFKAVMPWGDIEHVWRASLAQGIFEGLIYGLSATRGSEDRSGAPWPAEFSHS